MRPERAESSSGSVAPTDAGYSTSHTLTQRTTSAGESTDLCPPAGLNGTPGPSTMNGSADTPANLIDFNSPLSIPGNYKWTKGHVELKLNYFIILP